VLRRLFPHGAVEAGPRGGKDGTGRRTRPRRPAKMEAVTEGGWESLPVALSPGVLRALRELGFARMTPVQVRGRSSGAGKGEQGGGGEAGPEGGGRGRWQRRLGLGASSAGSGSSARAGGGFRSSEGRRGPWLSRHWLCLGEVYRELRCPSGGFRLLGFVSTRANSLGVSLFSVCDHSALHEQQGCCRGSGECVFLSEFVWVSFVVCLWS